MPPEASTVDGDRRAGRDPRDRRSGSRWLIRQVLIEPFRIPSGSMFPTLLEGDHLFVNKLARTGRSIPFTELRLPGLARAGAGRHRRLRGRTAAGRRRLPGRFHGRSTGRRRARRSEDFVKRLVGLPGDEITLASRVSALRERRAPGDAAGAGGLPLRRRISGQSSTTRPHRGPRRLPTFEILYDPIPPRN